MDCTLMKSKISPWRRRWKELMRFAARVILSSIVMHEEETKGCSLSVLRLRLLTTQATRVPEGRRYGRRKAFATLTRGGPGRLNCYRNFLTTEDTREHGGEVTPVLCTLAPLSIRFFRGMPTDGRRMMISDGPRGSRIRPRLQSFGQRSQQRAIHNLRLLGCGTVA